MSTFVGIKPLLYWHSIANDVPTVERRNRKQHKSHDFLPSYYRKKNNLHMGGVDLMDSS